MDLPYTIEVTRIPSSEGGGFEASIPLLGRYSAVGDGDTPDEAVADLMDHLPALLARWLEQGIAIPEPVEEAKAIGGSILVRLPKSLRSKIAAVADREGVSLNSFVTATLAEAVGARLGKDTA